MVTFQCLLLMPFGTAVIPLGRNNSRWRKPAALCVTSCNGPLRVFCLLHDARLVLLTSVSPGGFDITPWADRVRLVGAEYAGLWELPVLCEVPPPNAVLIRPDRHVAGWEPV
jgi:3-(3-hydroxy-phenyl)propionate hydroxylase